MGWERLKVIIAGSRTIEDEEAAYPRIWDCPWIGETTQVICGCAPGADRIGAFWAREQAGLNNNIYFPAWESQAQWAEMYALQDEVIVFDEKTLTKARKGAGHVRNRLMAEYAQRDEEPAGLIALWDGVSPGTFNMIQMAKLMGIQCHEVKL